MSNDKRNDSLHKEYIANHLKERRATRKLANAVKIHNLSLTRKMANYTLVVFFFFFVLYASMNAALYFKSNTYLTTQEVFNLPSHFTPKMTEIFIQKNKENGVLELMLSLRTDNVHGERPHFITAYNQVMNFLNGMMIVFSVFIFVYFVKNQVKESDISLFEYNIEKYIEGYFVSKDYISNHIGGAVTLYMASIIATFAFTLINIGSKSEEGMLYTNTMFDGIIVYIAYIIVIIKAFSDIKDSNLEKKTRKDEEIDSYVLKERATKYEKAKNTLSNNVRMLLKNKKEMKSLNERLTRETIGKEQIEAIRWMIDKYQKDQKSFQNMETEVRQNEKSFA
jgi:hypothetical protein